MSSSGIYFIVFENTATDLKTGALGSVRFRPGWHIYTGSALGKGGLLRVDRHLSLAEKKDKKPRWHIDYLLLSDVFSLRYAVFAETSEKLECEAAKGVGGDSVAGFGCSDCSCRSHLFFRHSDPFNELCSVLRSLGLSPQRIDADF